MGSPGNVNDAVDKSEAGPLPLWLWIEADRRTAITPARVNDVGRSDIGRAAELLIASGDVDGVQTLVEGRAGEVYGFGYHIKRTCRWINDRSTGHADLRCDISITRTDEET